MWWGHCLTLYQMIVIAHQTLGIASPALLEDFVTEQFQEMLPVGLVVIDRLLVVAASGEVVERARVFHAKLASHARGT